MTSKLMIKNSNHFRFFLVSMFTDGPPGGGGGYTTFSNVVPVIIHQYRALVREISKSWVPVAQYLGGGTFFVLTTL